MLWNVVLGIWIASGITLGVLMPPVKNLVAPAVMHFHVPMAITMEIAFLCAAIQGALWLKTRKREHDAKSFAFAEVGAWLGCIATITGSIWSRLNWGLFWSWDAQQIGIVAVLLTYAALFALRGAIDDEDKRRDLWAVYSIVGIISAIFWTVIFRTLVPSLHPNGTIKNSAPIYQFAFALNIAGYALVMTKLALMRAKIELLSQRAQDDELQAEYSASRGGELQTASLKL